MTRSRFRNKIYSAALKGVASSIAFSSNLMSIIYADPTGALSSSADAKFNLIVNTVASYGFKFGLLIIFYGAIQIGLAFKNDNPDGKVQGARTAIAGLIVSAVSAGADKFIS